MVRLYFSLTKGIERVLFILLSITLAILVALSLASVAMRLANSPLVWSDEMMRYLFVWMTMLGMVVASSRRAQITIDIVDQFIPFRFSRWIFTVGELIVMAFFIFLLSISFDYVSLGLKQISSALRWPMIWVYISFPIAFAGQIVMSLKQIATLWTSQATEGESHD